MARGTTLLGNSRYSPLYRQAQPNGWVCRAPITEDGYRLALCEVLCGKQLRGGFNILGITGFHHTRLADIDQKCLLFLVNVHRIGAKHTIATRVCQLGS